MALAILCLALAAGTQASETAGNPNLPGGLADRPSAKVLITVHPEQPGVAIPANFLGFSYEKSTLAGNHFNPTNSVMVNLFRNLGNGVLRLGGNLVEFTHWSRTSTERLSSEKEPTKINPQTLGPLELDKLYAFAKQSGWRVVHGLNLGANDPAMAADEAAYAMQVGGPAVLAFEIGNEPDLYLRNWPTRPPLRPAGYEYAQYRQEVETYDRAILNRTPHAPLAGPATAKNSQWFPDFVADSKTCIVLATSHFYPLWAGEKDPQGAKFASVENLLSPKTEQVWMPFIKKNQKAASAAGIPFRLGECNSASGGGVTGVSDSFAAALWGADFLFDTAERGLAGINFHSGFKAGGYTPFYYRDNHYHANPIYYSMLLFHQAARGRVVPVAFQTPINLTVHAMIGDDHKLRVVLLNKDMVHPVVAVVAPGSACAKAEVIRLTAPSLTSNNGVTLAGSAVDDDGTWTPQPGEPVQAVNGRFEVALPAASAALLTIE